ncbi:hypothetical protein EMPS_00014 [Entomortierella parvispora]|uniref:MARVEL domain-containing protein n=1 Tax=Entomortierella parvispora TaxID=205924 RepID=A0A9P3GYM1_9FUNG|nr:hypothetical protein EMPS_00014 [Entomortierella parvispora]
MLKKLGLVSKDQDSASSSPPPNSSLADKDKFKARHNKKVLKSTTSVDSADSPSIAPRPHLPSSVYNPNPFPLDPTLPEGLSRFHGFVAKQESSTREDDSVEIEVEERRGFVSGKSRQSMDQVHRERHVQETRTFEVEDVEYELAKTTSNPIQRLNAGFKGALAKSGLGKSKDRPQDPIEPDQEVDAVLQHHQRLQEQQLQQQQWASSQHSDSSSRPSRGRERERRGRQRTNSGPVHPSRVNKSAYIDDRALSPERRDRPSRLQSLSPPRGQEGGVRSGSYWPTSTDLEDEQKSPFLGYQLPPHAASRRPLSQTSNDSDGDFSRLGRDGRREGGPNARYHSRERQGSDRMRREVLAGGGQRRQSGLNNVISTATAVGRTSSELGTDDELSAQGGGRGADPPVQTSSAQLPDRLSRAKEWVATHSQRNSIVAMPEPAAADLSRPVVMAQRPLSAPTRAEYNRHRLSLDAEEYGMVAGPYRAGGYVSNPGSRFEARERMAMMTHMQMQGSSNPYRDSLGDNDRYWSHQLEGYEQDRYRYGSGGEMLTKEGMYGADRPGMYGRYYGYGPGGLDDADDEDESTLAPGSTAGGMTRPKKIVDTLPGDASQLTTMQLPGDGENQLASDNKVPNKRRLVLRIISLASSFFVLVLLIAASPVSHSSSPFSTPAGLVFHYVVAILSTVTSFAFVFNYFNRRLRHREKMKRYILFGLDIVMTLAWMIDIFVCIEKFPCAVGGQHGWCDMYNTSVFLGIIALLSFLAAFIWDIWGSFDHSKLIGDRPLIRKAPPGWDKKSLANQGAGPGYGGARYPGMAPGSAPGAMPGAFPGAAPGQRGAGAGAAAPPAKKSKALW